MLQKCSVVGTTAQVSDGHVAVGLCIRGTALISDRLGGRLRRGAFGLRSLLPGLVYGSSLRAGHGFGDVADELLEARNRRRAKFGSGDGDVYIEIRRSVRQFSLVLLDPFGRTHEAFFFAVPTAEHQAALWLPAGLQ